MAARLALLFSHGQTNGFGWPTDYSAKTLIQGEPLRIPWKTRAESALNQPAADGGANPQRPKPGVGIEEGDPSLDGGTEGDDISLTSEFGKEMQNGETLGPATPLSLIMNVHMEDPRTPVIGGIGAKNVHSVDVGFTLHKFDGTKAQHGTEAALRELFAGPCSTFRISLDEIVAHAKAQVFSASEIELTWAKLPGVKS
jgi:hypothetical protein